LRFAWQIFNDFIMACAGVLGNEQVPEDPKVEQHNHVQHFMQILIRACSEYIAELCSGHGATPYALVDHFIQKAEQNIDFAHLVHFLYDFGFLMLQFKQSVRTNGHGMLNLNWREFVTLGRSVAGHKTQ
jgi:hypothetical protein